MSVGPELTTESEWWAICREPDTGAPQDPVGPFDEEGAAVAAGVGQLGDGAWTRFAVERRYRLT